MTENGPMIHARGLVKRFGELVAVDGIDLDVKRGEAFGFLGPNGAGKSSTMRMIGCVSPISGGTLRILGLDPTANGPAIRARLGVVPQGRAALRRNEAAPDDCALARQRPRPAAARRADPRLDPQARHAVWDRLFRLKQQGKTFVVTTHYMDEAEQLCDRLVVMDHGKIVAERSPVAADPAVFDSGGGRGPLRGRAAAERRLRRGG